MASDDTYDRGMKVRREVLGDEYVDAALAGTNDFNRDFQKLVTDYCWGATWTRGGLARKQRSLNVLSMLGVLNRPHELEVHIHGALRNGCTPDEIRETLIQVAIYGGIPAGVDAFRVARKVWSEES